MGEKNTVDVRFKRDTLENIKNTPLKDGQVLWTIDQEGNDKIYNDVKQRKRQNVRKGQKQWKASAQGQG